VLPDQVIAGPRRPAVALSPGLPVTRQATEDNGQHHYDSILKSFCGQTGTGTFAISLQFEVPVPYAHETLATHVYAMYQSRLDD
jgi:hypothetical protein